MTLQSPFFTHRDHPLFLMCGQNMRALQKARLPSPASTQWVCCSTVYFSTVLLHCVFLHCVFLQSVLLHCVFLHCVAALCIHILCVAPQCISPQCDAALCISPLCCSIHCELTVWRLSRIMGLTVPSLFLWPLHNWASMTYFHGTIVAQWAWQAEDYEGFACVWFYFNRAKQYKLLIWTFSLHSILISWRNCKSYHFLLLL